MSMAARVDWYRYRVSQVPERALIALVWRLPHRVVMWATIRAGAHATTGSFSSTVVPEVTFMDVLKRWDDQTGGDRRVGQRCPGHQKHPV